jgi:hypothetical protein
MSVRWYLACRLSIRTSKNSREQWPRCSRPSAVSASSGPEHWTRGGGQEQG